MVGASSEGKEERERRKEGLCVVGNVANEKISQTGKESKFRVAVVGTPALFPRSPQVIARPQTDAW